jgi:hypothetical protein
VPKRTQASVELNNINMIKFKDINYNRNSYFISSIRSAALTGKSKTCKNFIWKYDAIER